MWACSGSTGTEIGTSTTLSYNDAPPLDRAYVYRVRARKLDTLSSPSAPTLATTVALSYYPVQVGVTIPRVAMLQQMRAAVDAVRATAGLGAATYRDAAVSALPIRTWHVLDLRAALDPARALLGFPPIAYTDPQLTPGSTRIRARHFNEIMEGAR
ncbi:MAG TPA: hypothetical protein VHF69_11515 [Candidatus Synoicihabitans sp.]|nr:hypothetical protein [Candidatus Synoicihabitans sp.]